MSNDDNLEVELVDSFTIGETAHPNKLRQHVFINRSDLSNEFAEHAERFAWYATAYELASDEELRLKEHLARVYAQVDAHVRAEAKAAATKLTEKMVENTVITHPKYVQVQEKYLDAKRNTGLLKAARDSMIHRRDMLISLGANYRAEGRSDISLKEEYYKNNIRNQ